MVMNRYSRILKHRLCDDTDVARALPAKALARLEAAVAASEQRHSGEIRLSVEAGLPLSYLWQGLRARDRAITLFGKLRVWDTEQNNGVLIYLLLAERAIEIVADRGLSRHVSQAQWQSLLEPMQQAFRAGHFDDGLTQAIAAIDALLLQHYALAPGEHNPNELPDRAVLL
jgi:uncharacterized membrane protein